MTVPSYLSNNSTAAEENQAANENATLENNGFFPAIELRDFTSRYHVNNSYSIERQLNLLQLAIQQTNTQLLAQVCRWNRAGYYALEDVPAQLIGECSELMLTYRQAVYAKAMALITERYRGTDTSRYGHQKAEAQDLQQVANDYDSEFRQAIYTLIGRPSQSIFAELI